MAMLFRPWAQPEAQQDHTISTTTDVKTDDEDVPREVKFKSIKEHMRKRSEKKSRRLKHDSERLVSHVGRNTTTCPTSTETPAAAALSSAPCPPPLIPPFPVLCQFDPFGAKAMDCWEELNLTSPELMEAALSQGFPPGLLEEYVRVLAEQQRQITERNRKQRPKKFRCPHCQVGFSNNGQLKGHIRIHTGERPFKCEAEQCGKSFTRNEELTRHRRIHSGLRPFPCPDCGKRFGRKDHLKKHVRTHYHQRYQLVPILPSHYPFLLGL